MSKMEREILHSLQPDPSTHVWRVAAATLRGFIENRSPAEVLKSMYPDDVVAPVILRAASTQATLTGPTWAAPLAHVAVSDAVQDVVAMSAIGKLISLGAIRVDMGRNATVVVPGRSQDPSDAINMWVGEGEAVPVKQYSLLGSALHVHKIEIDVVVTRELSEASNIDAVLRSLLTESGGLAIDAAVFSTLPASTKHSAGILNGLTPLASAATGIGFDTAGQDLGKIAQDVASRGGGRNIAFVAAPAQWVAMRFWPGAEALPVAASAVLASGTVIGLEPSSLACSFGNPAFAVSKVAALQMDDAPAGTITAATAPVKEMFQVDALVMKMTLWGDFTMRAPHVAYMDAVPW